MSDELKKMKRILALHRLAAGQANTPEGETAHKQAKVLEEKWGIQIPSTALESISQEIKTGYIWDRLLLEILTDIFEIHYENLDGMVTLSGPRIVIQEILGMLEAHRDTAEQLAVTASMGYLSAAIPEFADALIDQVQNRTSDEKHSDVKSSPQGDRYSDLNVFIRAFSNITHHGFIDHAREIGRQNKKPFWSRFFK